MSMIKQRLREKDKRDRASAATKKFEARRTQMVNKLNRGGEDFSVDSDAESERFPLFTPDFELQALKKNMQLGWADMAPRRKKSPSRQLSAAPATPLPRSTAKYSPGWKPDVKCPRHFLRRGEAQAYLLDEKDPRVTGKQLILESDAAAGVGDLEMEMALYKAKQGEGLFNEQDMQKPPDEWVHYPRLRTSYLPCARVMASFTMTPRGGYMFGGLSSDRSNELAHLNPQTMVWRKVVPQPDPLYPKRAIPPSPRSGHVAICAKSSHSIIFYGGETEGELQAVEQIVQGNDDKSMFPLTSKKVDRNRMLVEDDLMYRFDYRREQWTMLAPSPNPGPRYAPSLTTLKKPNTALLFGGVSTEMIKPATPSNSPDKNNAADDENARVHRPVRPKKTWVFKNDIWLLNTSTNEFTAMDTTGKPPAARAGHSAICVNTSSMLVFGGMHKEPHAPYDVYELKLTAQPMCWVTIHTHGIVPGPRICATTFMSPYDMSSVYLFGGTIKGDGHEVLMYDHGQYKWSRVPATSSNKRHVPAARYWHMGCLYHGNEGNVLQADDVPADVAEEDETASEAASDGPPSSVASSEKRARNLREMNEKTKDRYSMLVFGGTGATGYVPFDVFALHIRPAPFQENRKGGMYSKLNFKWDSAKHGMLRKPFKAWVAFVDENKRVRAIEQHEAVLTGAIPSPYLTVRPPDPTNAPVYAPQRVEHFGFPTGYSSFLGMTFREEEDKLKKSEFISKDTLAESRKKIRAAAKEKADKAHQLKLKLMRNEITFRQLRLGVEETAKPSDKSGMYLGFLAQAVNDSSGKQKKQRQTEGNARKQRPRTVQTTADLRARRQREEKRRAPRPMTTPITKARPRKLFNPSAKVDLGAPSWQGGSPTREKKGCRRSMASTLVSATMAQTVTVRPNTSGLLSLPNGPLLPGGTGRHPLVAGASISEWGFDQGSQNVGSRPATVGSSNADRHRRRPALGPVSVVTAHAPLVASGPTKTDEIIEMISGKDIRPPIWGRRNALMGKPVKRRGGTQATRRIAPAQCSSSLSIRLDIAAPPSTNQKQNDELYRR
jgi:hypothetical protein